MCLSEKESCKLKFTFPLVLLMSIGLCNPQPSSENTMAEENLSPVQDSDNTTSSFFGFLKKDTMSVEQELQQTTSVSSFSPYAYFSGNASKFLESIFGDTFHIATPPETTQTLPMTSENHLASVNNPSRQMDLSSLDETQQPESNVMRTSRLKSEIDKLGTNNLQLKLNRYYTPSEIADYIHTTGDEKGIAQTVWEMVEEGQIMESLDDLILFLERVERELESMKNMKQK